MKDHDLPPPPFAQLVEPPPERVTIALLMLWTAMSAFSLALDRWTHMWTGPDAEFDLLSQIFSFCYAPLLGATSAACCLAVWRVCRRGRRFPSQPGHWLLVLAGVTSIGMIGTRMLLLLLLPENQSFWSGTWGIWPYVVMQLVGRFLATIVNAFALYDSRGRWRVVFFLALAGNILSISFATFMGLTDSFHPFVNQADDVISYFIFGAILLAAVIDTGTSQPRRDVLHWTGIAMRIVAAVFAFVAPYLVRWLQEST